MEKKQTAESLENPSKKEEWLKTKEVLQILDIKRGTLYRLMAEKKLTPVPFTGNVILKHRRLRFIKDEVDKLLAYALNEPERMI